MVFGRKIALGLMAVNFKFKEMAMKIIVKHSEKHLAVNPEGDDSNSSSQNINELVKAYTVAVDMTCKEKVVKVFNLCLQLF